MKIKKAMLRYYVPFVFRCENNARFKAICELCRDNFGDQSDALVSEDDFFDNISKLYKSDNNSSIGYYFNSSKIELPELISDDKAYRVKISKAGLFLNKNGIGILWYEAVPSQTIIKDEKLLIRFQNSFKELARSKSDFSWKKYSASKIKLDYIHNKNEIITDKEKITDFLSQHNFSYDPNFLEKIEKIVLKKTKRHLLYNQAILYFKQECGFMVFCTSLKMFIICLNE